MTDQLGFNNDFVCLVRSAGGPQFRGAREDIPVTTQFRGACMEYHGRCDAFRRFRRRKKNRLICEHGVSEEVMYVADMHMFALVSTLTHECVRGIEKTCWKNKTQP